MKERVVWLDAARGLAAAAMLVFHLAVDLEDFFGYPVGYRYWPWQGVRYFSVCVFIAVSAYAAGSGLNYRPARRAWQILAAALAVSVVTFVFDRESYVRFGILHFLSCALLLTPLFLRLSDRILSGGIVLCFILGCWLARRTSPCELLLPLGLKPPGFVTIDYYPLFPWLGVFLSALLLGRRRGRPAARTFPGLAAAAWMGRRALLIYLFHQPLFLLILSLLHKTIPHR